MRWMVWVPLSSVFSGDRLYLPSNSRIPSRCGFFPRSLVRLSSECGVRCRTQ